jgi:hypothetical protein
MINQKEFVKLKVAEKWCVVSTHGNQIGRRIYRSFEIELYHLDIGFVEVWRGIGFQTVHWVELIDYSSAIIKYVDLIELRIRDV